MLQWMGGSRRKVTTSRRSTQKRQKQYFEQKKRQQQQTAGLDNNVDAINGCGKYHEKSKSLDILSFMNLATVAQESKSSLTIEESAEINPSPVKSHFLNCPPARIPAVVPKCASGPKEAKTNSFGYDVEYVSPKKIVSSSPVRVVSRSPAKIVSSHNHSSNRCGHTLDNHKTETEHQLSVLDLLGDDGANDNSGPVREAHVAFSVQGLGKMEMGTPVHSPKRPGRVSAPNPMKRHQSSKNFNYMNDLELELNSMIQDIDMPPCSNPWESPITPRGIKVSPSLLMSEQYTVDGSMPLGAHVFQRDSFFSEEEYPNIKIESEKLFEDGPRILDEDFPGEGTHDETWKNQAYTMDSTYADFLRDDIDDVSDFTFEDSYLTNKRDVAKALRVFNILESPASYFKHRASEEGHDFMNLEAKRYPGVNESWGFSLPTWSSFSAEDGKDNISLLSEESCSSSAVKGGKAKYSATKSILGKSPRKLVRDLCSDGPKAYIKKDLHAEGIVYEDGEREHRFENFKDSEKHARVPVPSRTKLFNQSNCTHRFQKDSDSHHTWLFEEGFTSIDKDSSLNSFPRTSAESGLASLECKYWCEDPFDLFPNSSLYSKTDPSCQKSKHGVPVKYAPSGSSLFSEEALSPHPVNPSRYYDSPSFFNIGSKTRKPDLTQASRMQAEPPQSYCATGSQADIEHPALSAQREVPEDESEVEPSGCGSSPKELEKDFSVGNNEFSSENAKTIDAPCSKGNSEGMEAENGTPEHSDSPITRDCPEQAEEASSAKKVVPNKVDRCTNGNKCQFDGHLHFPHRMCNEGILEKEDSGCETTSIDSNGNRSKNPPYQVMLESYVLQLLCVQKVLREASEQDSIKKV